MPEFPDNADYPMSEKSLIGPATRHKRIVPSDTDYLDPVPRNIVVNTDGVAILEDHSGEVISYNVFAGEKMGFRVVRVREGTTAELIGQW